MPATMDPPKGREEAKASDAAKGAEAKNEASAAGGGGIKAWLPLIISVVLMPALAFAMTRFVLLPKMMAAVQPGKPGVVAGAPAAAAEAGAEGKEGAKPEGGKFTVRMDKILANVAGTMGTRYLMTGLTLVGNTADFENKIKDSTDQLRSLANSTLSSKSIADLEKPGIRNAIRAELITEFNSALGAPLVQDIYITELAIQ